MTTRKNQAQVTATKNTQLPKAVVDTASLIQKAPLATLLQRAQDDPQALSTDNILQLRRMIGNQALSQMLSSGISTENTQQIKRQAASHTAPISIGLDAKNQAADIQRKTNIPGGTWEEHHKGTVALGSGSATTAERSVDVTDDISAKIMEKDANHYQTGHTIKEFAFEDSNITRSARSTLWPVSYTKEDALDEAEAVIDAHTDEIEQAVKDGGDTITDKSYQHGDFKYTFTMPVKDETPEPEDDEEDPTPVGTARLDQFYPISGAKALYADQADLYDAKRRLGK